MDTIQKVLIKAGRKDLAQEYFKKSAKIKNPSSHAIQVMLRAMNVKIDNVQDAGYWWTFEGTTGALNETNLKQIIDIEGFEDLKAEKIKIRVRHT